MDFYTPTGTQSTLHTTSHIHPLAQLFNLSHTQSRPSECIRGNLELSIFPKILNQIEPATFRLVDDLLYLLGHSRLYRVAIIL